MLKFDDLRDLADDIGGVFHSEDYEVLPFNHWKKDNTWMVMILPPHNVAAFIPVEALTARSAAISALELYKYIKEEDD